MWLTINCSIFLIYSLMSDYFYCFSINTMLILRPRRYFCYRRQRMASRLRDTHRVAGPPHEHALYIPFPYLLKRLSFCYYHFTTKQRNNREWAATEERTGIVSVHVNNKDLHIIRRPTKCEIWLRKRYKSVLTKKVPVTFWHSIKKRPHLQKWRTAFAKSYISVLWR